jgi:hypothetical protein
LRLFGPNVEKVIGCLTKQQWKTCKEKEQSTQPELVASASQSASRPNSTQYVGTPVIGTSRAAAAAGVSRSVANADPD